MKIERDHINGLLESIFNMIVSVTKSVKIGNHLGTIAEQLRIIAHCCTPRLPFIAMAAAFPAFSAAYSVFPTRLLQHTRWLIVIQWLTISLTLKAPTT